MARTHEAADVQALPEGMMLIRHEKLHDDGLRMGGDFVFEASAAGWLAEMIERAAEGDLPDTDADMAPDHFSVFIRGGAGYDDINVNLLNEREAAAPRGKLYSISGMSPDLAREVAAKLRTAAAG